MTIKQQGGVFGRNPTFNDVTTADLTAKDVTIESLKVDVGVADIQAGNLASGNAAVNIGRDDTSITNGNPLGYVQFLGSDNAAGSLTPHAYVKAVASGSHSATSNPTDIIIGTTAGASTTIVDNFTFGASGDLTVSNGNLVVGTSGKGIDFSATAGTGTSELFDDYEEGTWTPTVTSAAGAVTVLSGAGSTYTKIGNTVQVYARCDLSTDASVGTSDLTIAGLPYAAVGVGTGNLSSTNFSTGDYGTGGAHGHVRVSTTTILHTVRTVSISSRASFRWTYYAIYTAS